MKAPILSLAGVVAIALLAGCKPATESESATAGAPIAPPPTAPSDIQAPAATTGALIEIPVTTEGAAPQLMAATNTVSGGFNAPQSGDVRAVSIQIGNFGGTSDGTVSLKLCHAADCQEATAPVAGSTDNSYLEFKLPAPLTLTAGDQVTFTFTRVDGTQPFAIWTYPSTGAELTLPDATKAPRDAKIALTF